jgi:hypothetical protein
MLIRLYGETLVPSLIHVAGAGELAKFHPPAHVRDRQPQHETRQVSVALGPEHQVPVVGHDAEKQHGHWHDLERIDQGAHERRVIALAAKQVHSRDAAVENVMDDSAGGDACGSWHG